MGLTMLRIDRSKLKWKIKLRGAFDKKPAKGEEVNAVDKKTRREARGSKWSLFVLPLVTVLREGVEAVVFVAGVRIVLPHLPHTFTLSPAFPNPFFLQLR